MSRKGVSMPFRSAHRSSHRSIINRLVALLIVASVGAWSIAVAPVRADRRVAFAHGALANTTAITPAATRAADAELGHIRSGCPDCIPPISCTGSFWNAGYWPSLKLDAIGNPRIAYEVQLWSGGACSVGVIARVPRLAIFDQP
jgi:hypothetical protein